MEKIVIVFNDGSVNRVFEKKPYMIYLALDYKTGFVEISERYEYRVYTHSFPADKIKEIRKEF